MESHAAQLLTHTIVVNLRQLIDWSMKMEPSKFASIWFKQTLLAGQISRLMLFLVTANWYQNVSF